MFDLTEELQSLVQLYQCRVDKSRGAAIAFVGVRSGDGSSTCARAFARMIAPNAPKAVWLYDLDFYSNEQYGTFCSATAMRIYGALGAPFDPTLGQAPFWRVSPSIIRTSGRPTKSSWYLTMQQVGQHRLYVSRFRTEDIRLGQSIHLTRAPSYWQNLRNKVDLAVIDVPARDRARSILAVAPDMDGVVLVAGADISDADIITLQTEIQAAGGKCLGVIYNHRRAMPHNSHWTNGR